MAIGVKVVKGSAQNARRRRHFRVRKRVVGSAERPRLVVSRSSRHLVAQIVDDSIGQRCRHGRLCAGCHRAAGHVAIGPRGRHRRYLRSATRHVGGAVPDAWRLSGHHRVGLLAQSHAVVVAQPDVPVGVWQRALRPGLASVCRGASSGPIASVCYCTEFTGI